MSDRDDEDLLDKFGLGGESKGCEGVENTTSQLHGDPLPATTGPAFNPRQKFSILFQELPVSPGYTETALELSPHLFRGYRLAAYCPDGADDLVIADCYVGHRRQSALFGAPVSGFIATTFGKNTFGKRVLMDTAEKDVKIFIDVKNTGNVPRRVTFTIFGDAVVL